MEKDIFFLNKVFPEAGKILTSEYKTVEEIYQEGLVILDTNVLLVPFNTNKKNLEEISLIFTNLKQSKRLLIPSRVIREFAKNRAKKIGEVFLNMNQTKDKLNHGLFNLNSYPILDEVEEYKELKKEFSKIKDSINKSRKLLNKIEEEIQLWTWNDRVSNMYKKIFTEDIIIDVIKREEELKKDLNFRIQHKIPPGFKDSTKLDDGIGDIIIWQTILEIGKNNNKDVLFITNDQKNDWSQNKTRLAYTLDLNYSMNLEGLPMEIL